MPGTDAADGDAADMDANASTKAQVTVVGLRWCSNGRRGLQEMLG